MNITIYSDRSHEALGRRLAHLISFQSNYATRLWSFSEFRYSEPSLQNDEPIILLGRNATSEAYLSLLPKKFSGFGTTCQHQGAKAALTLETPKLVAFSEFMRLEKAMTTGVYPPDNEEPSGGWYEIVVGYEWMTISNPIFWQSGVERARERRKPYRELQYQYLLNRFMKEEFECFISGVPTQ